MKTRWIGILALACAVSATSIAQPPPPSAGIIGIANIAFRVSDLDHEIAFLGKLGYEESFAMTNGGKTTEVFIKINDRQFIELFPQTDPSQPLGFMRICYEAGDLNALEKYYDSVGLKPSPVRKAAAGNIDLVHERSRGPRHRVHPVHARLAPHPRQGHAPRRAPHLR